MPMCLNSWLRGLLLQLVQSPAVTTDELENAHTTIIAQ